MRANFTALKNANQEILSPPLVFNFPLHLFNVKMNTISIAQAGFIFADTFSTHVRTMPPFMFMSPSALRSLWLGNML